MSEAFRDEPDDEEQGASSETDRRRIDLRKIEPMEMGEEDDNEEEEEDDDEDYNGSGNGVVSSINGTRSGTTSVGGGLHAQQGPDEYYLNGRIKAQRIGNVKIFFPEYFQSSGWGVLGPQWYGPACVWGILVVATHFCLRSASKLGTGSVVFCYLFFGACTYFLSDVSLRDPGICLHKEVPASVPPTEIHKWRWCDICQVYQPPGGAHCRECNVCIAGYDHYCVWMGTCIGGRNYRQFVRFNVSWLYYVLYAVFWLTILGPLFKN